jgi:DNA-binding XRE family transcriptional regulator
MIRSEAEYQAAIKRLDEHRDFALQQRAALEAMGLAPDQVDRAMEATVTFQAQIAEDIDWYEKVRRKNFEPVRGLTNVGRLLIALRIAYGLSQKQLADKLGVSESSISRDERNEYHGLTLERAQRVASAFAAYGASVKISIETTEINDTNLIAA